MCGHERDWKDLRNILLYYMTGWVNQSVIFNDRINSFNELLNASVTYNKSKLKGMDINDSWLVKIIENSGATGHNPFKLYWHI